MISIAIATHNRAAELGRTLRALEALKLDDDLMFEVLVIDNNSSDGTRMVSEEFASRSSVLLRYFHEPRQGLSYARNRAIDEARYEIVAFIDDDVDVDSDWLIGLASAFTSGDYAAVGGRAYLSFPGSKPRWLGERDEGFLTKVELGCCRRPAAADEIFGVNLAIKKEWVERVGGFRTDLGRVGTCLISSEEGEILERIVAAGGRLLYEPSAVVGHRVAAERLSRRWFWSRNYRGHWGEIRRWRRSDVTAYALFRATWHMTLAAWQIFKGLIFTSLRNEEMFHRSLVLAGRLGTWTGLVGAMVGRDLTGKLGSTPKLRSPPTESYSTL